MGAVGRQIAVRADIGQSQSAPAESLDVGARGRLTTQRIHGSITQRGLVGTPKMDMLQGLNPQPAAHTTCKRWTLFEKRPLVT
ncbi:hypothetical protein PCANC_13042 [Puccinia coronata f. sp. avenae]|uniref:Uncharacterized protein n=1 Tax=Puccinia coronata f. sp. avenae TaxID=200324 RepID=A0A2N5USA5_9BASI|nr:hypothetical protein PCANC_13042 [Puccinia coronata f. sp. avenae]